MSFESTVNLPQPTVNPSFSGTRSPPAPRPLLRRRSTIKLLYGPGIASPGLALSQDIVHMPHGWPLQRRRRDAVGRSEAQV